MTKNSFETQENPEVKELFSMFYHNVSHFLFKSNPDIGAYNVRHLQESKESTDELLRISQNKSLISVLHEIKKILDGIDTNSTPDTAILSRVSELKEAASIERKY